MFYFRDNKPEPNEEDQNPEELTDEQLKILDEGKSWAPEGDSFEQFIGGDEGRLIQPKVPSLRPSDFAEFAFRMPDKDGGYQNFSFEGRRHMVRLYDSPARRILLFAGRQVEKSTLLGNRILTYACLAPAHRTLYVSPSATQTKVFSMDRLKEAIDTSPVLRGYTSTMLSQNILEKQLVNRSKITLRYAFLNADRVRGIPAYLLAIDELQDILADNIPIIEQCTAHAPEKWKMFIYAGTPKGLDNPLEFYRSGSVQGRPMSTMGEWVVPCDRHGGEGGRYWNILGEKNIQRKGLSCERCGELIDPMHRDAQWAMQCRDGVFESYRMPQLMVPWKPWIEILLDYERYPRDRFYNEVLGISYDSGLRPITMVQLRNACNDSLTMHPNALESFRRTHKGISIFAGLDIGTGENAYSVLSLGTYVGGKFRIFFIHRFTGTDTDPEIQNAKIEKIIHAFGVRVFGMDYGGGFSAYKYFVRRFGMQRIQRYQYMPRSKKKLEYDARLQRWKVHRTEIMSDVFVAIKRGQFEFPRWEEFKDPFGQDILNIFSEYNETMHTIQYQHRLDRPDDAFHSILYCFLASLPIHPRPDIIVPKKENSETGPLISQYSGPLDQSLCGKRIAASVTWSPP